MKKMYQFPGATSANTLLLFALCIALALCTAKHEDDFTIRTTPFIRNRPVNHQNVIISHEEEPFPKSLLLSNLIYSNEAQHDEKKIIKSATHDERLSSSNGQNSATTGSAPLGVSPSLPAPHPAMARRHRESQRKLANIKSASDDDDVRNFATPHSSRHLLQRRDIRHSTMPANLCNVDGCKCTGGQIKDVECRLPGKPFTFDHQYNIPMEVRSLAVHLDSFTRLTVHHGFFRGNAINRILILGPKKDSRTHVEFMQNALEGNKAPNLSVEIINCETVVLKNGTFHGEIKLNITKCGNALVDDGALSQTSFDGVFDTISDLRMEPHALNGGELSKVLIRNSYIQRLENIGKTMTEIRVVNSIINEIASKAFDFANSLSIVFEKTRIEKIEPEAFTTRLWCSTMRIIGCNITTISREAIAGCGCTTVSIEQNTIRTIEDKGISVSAVSANISYNMIGRAGRQWLKVREFSNLEVNNNSYGQFGAMDIQGKDQSSHCEFIRNSITQADGGSLRLPQNCIVKDVYFRKQCTCDDKWLVALNVTSLNKMMDVSYCSTDETLKHCFNSSLVKLTTFKREICGDAKTIDCMKTQNEPKHEGNFIKPGDFDKRDGRNNVIYYISGGVVLFIVLCLLIGFLILLVRKRGNRHDRTELITPTPEHSHHSAERVPKSTRIFTPEDQIIINQTLDKMKLKYPAEKYDQVFNNTQKLFNGSLTESEKVLTIGEIVGTLSKCENSGEDFVAFTDILYKHLAPKDNNQNDPVYAEPNHIVSNDDDRNTQLDLNHIYAEPHSVQQPLLNNEYAFPVDRNTESGLYTEPVVSSREPQRKLISPYAIGGTNVPEPPERVTPPNLPDVLSQSTSSSSATPNVTQGKVQRLANEFANNPNFHITRSPRSNRTIPKYTIPTSKGQSSSKDGSTERDHSGAFGLQKKNSASSDHSGGSDITVKMDDVIDYADA